MVFCFEGYLSLDDAQARGRIRVEEFQDLLERNIGVMQWGEGEQGVAQERHVGEGIGLVGSRTVLAPEVVPAPVIADFDAGPMAADQALPLCRRAFLRILTGEIKPGLLGGDAGFLGGDLAAHDDDAAGPGEAGGNRLYGEDVQAALLGAAVAGVRC